MKSPAWLERLVFRLANVPSLRRCWVRVWKRQFGLGVCHADRVPRDRAVIFAGNQASHYDGPFAHTVLLEMFGQPAVAIADPCVHDYPVVRELAATRALECIIVEKDARKPMQRADTILRMIEALEAGRNVIVNPEGDPFDELAEFQPGAAYAAIASGAPIVPFTVRGTRGLFPIQPWPARYRGEVSIVFHEPVEPLDFERPGVKRTAAAVGMMEEVRRRVVSAIDYPDSRRRAVTEG